MDRQLLETTKEKYDRDGYVIIRDVLDQETIRQSKEHVEWLIQKHPDTRPEKFGKMYALDDPFWIEFLRDDRLLDVAETFVGPHIALFTTHYICKPPFDGKAIKWHQDGIYWNELDPVSGVITMWLAVDDSTRENGCMRVIPGSHQSQLYEKKKVESDDYALEYQIDQAWVDESQAVDIILQAGDVSIHHPNIIHGSEANLSANSRCGLTIRYIPTSTKVYSEGKWNGVFLMRGEADTARNRYLPRPTYVEGKHFRPAR